MSGLMAEGPSAHSDQPEFVDTRNVAPPGDVSRRVGDALAARLRAVFELCNDRLFDAAFVSATESGRQQELRVLRRIKASQTQIIQQFCEEVELRFTAPGAVVPLLASKAAGESGSVQVSIGAISGGDQ